MEELNTVEGFLKHFDLPKGSVLAMEETYPHERRMWKIIKSEQEDPFVGSYIAFTGREPSKKSFSLFSCGHVVYLLKEDMTIEEIR